jgi:hypothetical protein
MGGPSAGAFVPPAVASSDSLTAGGSAPAPGANSTAAPSARGDGGTGSHLSEMVHSPSLSSSSSDDEFANIGGGESPCCSRSWYSSLYCSRRSRQLSFFSFARVAHSYSRRCAARQAALARGVGGSDRAALKVTICGQGSSG